MGLIPLVSTFQAGNALLMNLSDVQQASSTFSNLTHIFGEVADVVPKLTETIS